MRPLLLISSFCVLLGIATTHIYYNFIAEVPSPRKTLPLEEAVTRDLKGWTTHDLPLAQTEEMRERVDEMLNFDEYISRIYKQGNTEIILYIASWETGKISVKEVHTHTPDICWVGAGWEATDHQTDIKKTDQAGDELLPAQGRTFKKNGTTSHVHFWHIVGNTVYTNKLQEKKGVAYNSIRSVLQYGINTRKEQFFVRVSSNKPIDTVWQKPGFEQIIQDLSDLCHKPANS